jgi:hypothetical protein
MRQILIPARYSKKFTHMTALPIIAGNESAKNIQIHSYIILQTVILVYIFFICNLFVIGMGLHWLSTLRA